MLHVLTYDQLLKTDRETAWKFISDPKNLGKITPSYMNFKILNQPGEEMYPGQIIEYRVSPVLGIPLPWVTEITHVKDLHYFVDEQRFGPYRFWHHQHHLMEAENGILMRDIVHYSVPLGILGKLVNALVIRKQLRGIFAHRHAVLEKLYNTK